MISTGISKESAGSKSLSYSPFVPPSQFLQEPKKKILLVDDDPCNRLFFKKVLEAQNFTVETAPSLESFRAMLQESFHYDAYVVDLFLGDGYALDVLPEIAREAKYRPIFILTGHSSIKLAVDAIRLGASGYLLKTDNPEDIAKEIQEKISSWIEVPEPPFRAGSELGLIGISDSISRTISQILRIKDADTTVLVTGESGTGKEVVARALHNASSRRSQPFLAINAGAIPEMLLESELFGYRKGSFTDAKADRKGVFEHCAQGSILLDEIGEMPASLQAKLLRVLQEKEVMPIGSHQPVKINTRVIAATNRNLEEEVRAGRFREDLYYRLSVFNIHIPALRERREDILPLAHHFIEIYSTRYQKVLRPLPPTIQRSLEQAEWRGNVRELQNAIERAVVLSVDGKIAEEDLFPMQSRLQSRTVFNSERGLVANSEIAYRASDSSSFGATEKSAVGAAPPLPFARAKQAFERDYVIQLLKSTHGNIAEASRLSGQYRANLYRMMSRYKIEQEDYRH